MVLTAAALAVAPNAVAQEGPAPPAPMSPVNTSAPTISGEAEVGQVLTAAPGSWTLDPTFQYQWERCSESIWGPPPYQSELECKVIAGAAAATYTVSRSDEKARLRVRVTASSGGTTGAPVSSAPTEPVGRDLIPTMTASGALTPEARPNRGQSAAILHLGFRSGASNASVAPPLRSISFDLSRDLSLHAAGLRSCTYNALLSSVAVSEGACAAAKVGHGEVESELEVNSNYEYTPVKGHLTAYYVSASAYESPRILARVQIRHPSPIVYVLPFRIEPEKGRFATRLLLPEMRHIAGIILPGYTFPYAYDRISSLNMVLGTSFAFHGETKSFVTASCPARHGAQKAGFRIARANLSYSGSSTPQDGTLSQTVDSRCKAT